MNKGNTYNKGQQALITCNNILYEGGATLDKVLYPIGSIYMSVNSTNPSQLFGGTWAQITGRFLYCTDNSKQTGGSETHSHGAGSLVACFDPINAYSNQLFRLKDIPGGFTLTGYIRQSNGWNDGGGAGGRGVEVYGSTQSTNILPPYFTVYCWYRVS